MNDTGATLGLGYTNQLEKAQSMVAHIEPSKRHKFRFGNGEQRESCSEVTMNFAGTGTFIKLQAVESPPGAAGTATDGVPILIGADWLDQEGATIRYGTKTMQLAKLERTSRRPMRSGRPAIAIHRPSNGKEMATSPQDIRVWRSHTRVFFP
jgi:hypothetical protein